MNTNNETGKICDECGDTEHNADHKFTTMRIVGEKFTICNECNAAYKALAEEITKEVQ